MQLRRNGVTYIEGDKIPPSNAHKVQVEAHAQKVLDKFEFKVGQHPCELVASLKGHIYYQDMGDWFDEDGSILVHGPSDFDILLPRYTSPRRDRFTIAHELGHYFLHSQQGEKPIVAYRRGSSRIEWEANWFAAALLMPEEPFRRAMNTLQNISAIAEQFGISEDAALVRRKTLGE